MAHVQKLPDHALDAIAKQVGKLYPSLDNNVTQAQPLAALTETFPIWTLSIDAIDTGKNNLLELVQDTHRWHSQILIDGKPEAVARSIVLDGDASSWSVKQVLKGDLAKTVDDAIRWIDAEVETDSLVRILEVPAFFITALWLIDGQESSIVIAKCPESLQELNRLVQYSSQEFLEILRRESPAVGIRDERPQRQHRPVPEASQLNRFNVLSINTKSDTLSTEQGWRKLKGLIQSIKPADFERLVAALLTSFLKVPFVVARSGDQPRGDARNLTDETSIQVKNYSEGNKPRDIEIVRDSNIVRRHLQDLQVYVLVISRDISEQSLGELETVSEETGLDIVTLELSDGLSDLGALCVTYWEDIHHFFNLSDIDPQFSVWVQITRGDSKTQAQMEKVQSKLEDRIHTQSHVQKSTEEYLLNRFNRDEGFNPINLSQAIDRDSLESQITNWWETEEATVCCLEGKEGHGKTWLASKWMNSIREKENIVPFWLDSKDWEGAKSIPDLLRTCFRSIYPSYEEGKITKLQNKPAKIWHKTLIVLDGVNERNAIEAAQRIFTEYFRDDEDENEWRNRVRFLLTARRLGNYPDFENYLWSRCYKIPVGFFDNSELQEVLTQKGLQPDDLPDSLKKDVARIPQYLQRCIELRDKFDSLPMVTVDVVLWADLLDKIERTDLQIKQKLGWDRAKDAQEILSDLAKQAKWTNVDAA